MANGILIDEATYFNNNEKYTGNSGSETNMWIVQDVYDLCALGDSDSYPSLDGYIYAKLVNNIDFNNHPTYKKGVGETIIDRNTDGNYLILDGNGKEIRNLYVYGSASVISVKEIRNTTVQNVLLGGNCITFSTIDNCNFTIYCKSTESMAQSLGATKVKDCTFNYSGRVYDNWAITFPSTSSIETTHFNFNNLYVANGNPDTFVRETKMIFRCAGGTLLASSYFTGKITFNNTIGYIPYIIHGCNIQDVYVAIKLDVEVESGSGYPSYPFRLIVNGNINGANFIDYELFGKWLDSSDTHSNFRKLTTEQAQNPDYLNSIGFITIPID